MPVDDRANGTDLPSTVCVRPGTTYRRNPAHYLILPRRAISLNEITSTRQKLSKGRCNVDASQFHVLKLKPRIGGYEEILKDCQGRRKTGGTEKSTTKGATVGQKPWTAWEQQTVKNQWTPTVCSTEMSCVQYQWAVFSTSAQAFCVLAIMYRQRPKNKSAS